MHRNGGRKSRMVLKDTKLLEYLHLFDKFRNTSQLPSSFFAIWVVIATASSGTTDLK